MPGADRTRLLMILAWGAAFVAALVLARFAPAPIIALLIPLAGAVVWLAHSAEERARNEALAALDALIEDPESDERDPGPATTNPDPLASMRDKIERRNRWISSAIDREVESGAMLRAYLNAIDTPVIATRESGRIAMMNRPARRLFDRGVEGDRTGIADLLTSQDVLGLHRRAAGGEACQTRVRLTLRGQTRFYEISAIPVRVDISDIPARVTPRTGVVLTFRDVHDLANTLQLRTDFAANASHELRTPIATIKTAIETMRGSAADDPGMQNKLGEVIENNVIRLEETVNDLLDLSRLESDEEEVRAEPLDGIELCLSLQGVFEHVCERRGLTLAFDLDPALTSMVSDRKLLLLIIRNLVDNATKFAFENTEIRIVGEALPPPATGRGAARFSVIDRGIGIPLKHQERVFERFYQVDESRARIGGRRGSGLGLSIVRHALRSLEGEIDVESVWQEGTRMTVTIPRCVDASPEHDPTG